LRGDLGSQTFKFRIQNPHNPINTKFILDIEKEESRIELSEGEFD